MIMSSALIPSHLSFGPPNATETANIRFSKTRRLPPSSLLTRLRHLWKLSSCSVHSNLIWSGNSSLIARGSGDDGGAVDAALQQSEPPNIEETVSGYSNSGDGYVPLFVSMLGLDHDPLDREQAVVALWKYSLGGKKFIDEIVQFHGCIYLTVNLLSMESSSTCEAAAGLLRSISSVNMYRDYVAEAGAIEEITGLLTRASLAPEVKEQSLCTLWNLAVDEKYRLKIADSDVLPVVINCLGDEDVKVKEAAGGVLSTLSLSPQNHDIMVELGVIPKMAAFLRANEEGSKVVKKESRNALLELAKNEYYKILIIEEGLVPVPIVGAAAYKSFRPSLYSWPSLPDGTEIDQTSKVPSRFGASELLIGLNITDNNLNLEEVKMKAIVGRTQQQFLARIGAIELDDERKSRSEASGESRLTLLPCIDGVARLVLILGLEDEAAISRAAESIAASAINEYMREFFKEAGAVKLLVQLLDRNNASIKSAVTCALERLSLSNGICQIMEAEGVIYHLVSTLKQEEIPQNLMEKTLTLLARILDPSKEMKSKFYDGPINGSKKSLEITREAPFSKVSMDNAADIADSIPKYRKDVQDPSVIDRLVEIMKISSPNLQRKAASVLEFVTVIDPSINSILSSDIESGLEAMFKQKVLNEVESDTEVEEPEKYAVEIEEAGLAVSAASRLLTKLLDSEHFCKRVDSSARFTSLLRKTLKSAIPISCKEWVAASLVKLSSLRGGFFGFEDSSVNVEVTLYETIPRLIQKLNDPFSLESRESAVVELNRVISEGGVVDSTRAVASEGAIFPLVRVLEEGSLGASEAALAVLYNLSMDDENHAAIAAAGAVPVLRRIVLSQRPHWTRALRLLRNLPI